VMVDPEVTTSSERMYEGKRIAVRFDHVRLSDGTESTRDIVETFDAVVIVALEDNGDVLFVRQYRKAPEVELLELPAGAMDPGETDPEQSALRELREETGYSAGEMIKLGSFYASPGVMTELLHCYLARKLTYDPLPADEDERIELERMSFADAISAGRSGVFQDSKTLASLFLAALYV
jgi:ADP-ribose pyrophosphatase